MGNNQSSSNDQDIRTGSDPDFGREVVVKRQRFEHPDLKPFLLKDVEPTGIDIGIGSYGSVQEVSVNGVICAAKTIHKVFYHDHYEVESVGEKFLMECTILSRLRHRHIVRFLGIYYLPGSHFPSLVTERLQMDLDKLLQNKSRSIYFNQKVSILRDVAAGLLFLHSQSPPVIHRDLTARNVLLTSSMVAKIGDLGTARILSVQSTNNLTSVPGTLVYMPPEALTDNPRYSTSIDIFSYGNLAIYTLSRQFPDLKAATYLDSKSQMLAARTEVERREDVFQELYKELGEQHKLVLLCKHCLNNSPAQRPSAQTILKLLEVQKGRMLAEQNEEDVSVAEREKDCNEKSIDSTFSRLVHEGVDKQVLSVFEKLAGTVTACQFRQIKLVCLFLGISWDDIENVDSIPNIYVCLVNHSTEARAAAVLQSLLQMVGVDSDIVSKMGSKQEELKECNSLPGFDFARMILKVIRELDNNEKLLFLKSALIKDGHLTQAHSDSIETAEGLFRHLYQARIIYPNNVQVLLETLIAQAIKCMFLVQIVKAYQDSLDQGVGNSASQCTEDDPDSHSAGMMIKKEEIEDVDPDVEPPCGSYGYVKKVRYKGKLCAGKFFFQKPGMRKQIKKEDEILTKLLGQQYQHPNIVQYIGGNTMIAEPFLIMELLETNLCEYLQSENNAELPLVTILDLLHQVSKGLVYLHECDVIHRDLTANNVLLTHDTDGKLIAKVADFGNSRVIELNLELSNIATMTEHPGNLLYCAPETIDEDGLAERIKYNHKADIFSFGHLSTVIVIKKFDCKKQVIFEGVKKIRQKYQHDLEKKLGADHEFVVLVKTCLCQDYHERPSADKLQRELSELCFKKVSPQSSESETDSEEERRRERELIL